MANLRDRLIRIQEQKKREKPTEIINSFDISSLIDSGWETCGFQTLKREVTVASPFKFNILLPQSLAVIVPDLSVNNLPKPKDFIFFDLETTGLSGGAGTVAFLAAFGKFSKNGKLCITQYLLLDYSGENDFLEAVLKEFSNEQTVIVSYNGKCFDSQILKTRCLMNGIKPPEYRHADLLHPARRLWKNIIQDCSQGSVETRIIGLDRSGDIPGALAPEIWFEFLKTGRTERLMGICDHNIADIKGLASILAVMISIASDPLDTKYQFDITRIALYWRDFCRRRYGYSNPEINGLQLTGIKILKHIADSDFPDNIKAVVLRVLAIDSERIKNDTASALKLVKQALKLKNAGNFWLEYFEKKAQRLEKKLQKISRSTP